MAEDPAHGHHLRRHEGTGGMTRRAARVHADRSRIERMAALCSHLDEEERVSVALDDGSQVTGVVLAKPSLQTFLDADGNEGLNAVVKLDDVGGSGRARSYWLDLVVDVRQCAGSATGYRLRAHRSLLIIVTG